MQINVVCIRESRSGAGKICFCNKPNCNTAAPKARFVRWPPSWLSFLSEAALRPLVSGFTAALVTSLPTLLVVQLLPTFLLLSLPTASTLTSTLRPVRPMVLDSAPVQAPEGPAALGPSKRPPLPCNMSPSPRPHNALLARHVCRSAEEYTQPVYSGRRGDLSSLPTDDANIRCQ
ncbi:unnamed protein product [Protopolystoma xenopodis]|uniref:Uncharacterized protein n=1 Tax=Protopolystoma xenopodis TaxID=117903 RepID=A0A3S5BLP3_9PLAT|nr:unnamed protein product [Protopolystoma xenopodis]